MFIKKKITNLLLQKKEPTTSHVLKEKEKEKKKNLIITIHLYSNVLFLSAFVIYLNSNTLIIFIKKKNTNLFLQKKTKKTKKQKQKKPKRI